MTSLRKMLCVDDRFVESCDDLRRTFCTPEICSENPVIRADRAWERDAAFIDSGLVVYDAAEDLFKAWYQGGACYGPDDRSNLCYAVSKDGICWQKPPLGLIEFEGSKENNLVLVAHCMMHDPAPIIDAADPDPGRRYKAIWWGGRRESRRDAGWLLGHCVGFSPDGIHWTEHPENPVWPSDGEVAIPFGIKRTGGRHVMYNSVDGHGIRVVGRSESDDFVRWDLPPRVVLKPDASDPPGTEMAGLASIDYEGTHIGLLYTIHNLGGIARDEWQAIVQRNMRQGFFGPPIEMNNTRCRTMFSELVTSEDGIAWKRVHRAPFLPMGPEGSWDEVIGLAGRPIVARDRIWIYYTGVGRTTQTPGLAIPQKLGTWNVETGLATLRLDGFASLDAPPGGGMLLTRRIRIDSPVLQLNLDARAGQAVVEVLECDGSVIPGFGAADAGLITGDQLRAPVSWKGAPDLSPLMGRTVRLRISLKNCRLYAISLAGERGDE